MGAAREDDSIDHMPPSSLGDDDVFLSPLLATATYESQHGREAWRPRQPAGAALLQGGRLDNGARWLRPRGIEQAAPRQPIRQESGQRLGRSQPWSDLAGFLGRAGDLGGSGKQAGC
uniref:Uncharacterized protein n=1 Tax=Oryza sativa subsp. japonica TaxID=39947 RepID=Q6YTN8_ORYSJ|nr:hypothetical protein [Oryza sativa Japonica Group]